jgi:DNA-binding transcriptional ArsR family regulator
MELSPAVGLFGNKTSALILLYLQNYGEGNIAGIARAFSMNKNRVYSQLLKLEKNGLLVARSMGNQRIFSINPRFVAKDELARLLEKLLRTLDDSDFDKYFAERRRPRRTKKAL